MPAHAAPQLKSKRGHILIPRPLCRQIGHDRVDPVLRHVLSKENQVVEDGHHRILGRIERFLVDRHARRTVVLEHSEHTAALLRRCRLDRLVRGGGRAIEEDDLARHNYRDDNCPQNNADRYLPENHVFSRAPRCPVCRMYRCRDKDLSIEDHMGLCNCRILLDENLNLGFNPVEGPVLARHAQGCLMTPLASQSVERGPSSR